MLRAAAAARRAPVAALRAVSQRASAAAAPSRASSAAPTTPEGPKVWPVGTIAPSAVPGREYKNDYFTERGFTVADKSWTEWSDLPAPYKYMAVKVNPEDVSGPSPLWSALSDWRLAVPIAALCAMPLYITGNFPGLDERMELSFITILAATVILREAHPIVENMVKGPIQARVAALYEAEKGLNDTLDGVIAAYSNGTALPATMAAVHAAERALRGVEAAAATRKAAAAERDALVAQLDYLVALRNTAAGATEGAAVAAARSAVEDAFAKDAALQARSIDAAVKALKDGAVSSADDVVGPAFAAALAKAKKDAAGAAAANPFASAANREIFDKRFGFDGGARKVGAATVKSPFAYIKK